MTSNSFIEAERYLLNRAGYSEYPRLILLGRLENGPCSYDPYDWGDRTFKAAHEHITKEWENLVSGDVIDVEFILEETPKPKESERLEVYEQRNS